jgi:hypothetical protein
MAKIDVSELLRDPDFTDVITLIKRKSEVNEYGENVLTEYPCQIVAVVQGANTETMTKLPEGARLGDMVDVYYQGTLTAERKGGYADIIVYSGKRYQVKEVVEDYLNHGTGFTKAVCVLEPVNAN